jgi:hypothetical protein
MTSSPIFLNGNPHFFHLFLIDLPTIVLPELQGFYGRAIVIIRYACLDADKRHKQTPVNYHFRSIPVSLQGSTWTNLRLGVVLTV